MASFQFAFNNLRNALRARPILALSITNGVLAGVSDVLAQKITHSTKEKTTLIATESVSIIETEKVDENNKSTSPASANTESLDITRTARFAAYGFAIAPIIHHWYALLDRRFPLPVASSGVDTRMNTRMLGQVVKRVLGDQVMFAPVGLAVFFSIMTLFEGGGVAQIKEKLKTSYVSALSVNYMVWPAVQFVNFCFVPLLLRVPFVSAVSVFWNSYLSYLNNQRVASSSESPESPVTVVIVE
ncbi:hypothetical protein BDF22DRAFT_777939 [Syncephalis plumigaleata]|nr:hypothetical protein BDF22DRAFT_777939 [Syncephalis plumigaleata]